MTAKALVPSSAKLPLAAEKALPGASCALALLLSINLFNYIDRQVLAAVEPEIEQTLGLDQHPNGGFWMGLLSTAFLVSYMLTAPFFGWLADHMRRWILIGIGVLLWSVASGSSGITWPVALGTAFWLLLLTRALVGIGEGAYGPVAPTVLSDLYPIRFRGQVMSWFYLAIPVGSALGYALGDLVKGTALGWRWAFYLVMPPGLLLGLWCLLMRDPTRGGADPGAAATDRGAGWKDYLHLLRIPSYVLDTLGMTAMTFAMGGLAYWIPKYLEMRQQLGEITQVGGLGARTFFGVLTASCGLVATLAGGFAGDRLRARFPGSYFLVSGTAMLLSFPLILLILWTPFPLAWVFLGLAVFCLFFNTGPTNTILANVTHPAVRASAFALNILIIHALGDAISPPVIGFIRDWTKSLDAGFTVVSLFVLIGGVLWLWGARYLERDTALAPTRLKETG